MYLTHNFALNIATIILIMFTVLVSYIYTIRLKSDLK